MVSGNKFGDWLRVSLQGVLLAAGAGAGAEIYVVNIASGFQMQARVM